VNLEFHGEDVITSGNDHTKDLFVSHDDRGERCVGSKEVSRVILSVPPKSVHFL